MSKSAAVLVLLGLLFTAGCQKPAPAGTGAKTAPPKAVSPAEKPPADVSHGEAAVGTTAAPPPVDPHAPASFPARLKHVRLEIQHARLNIDEGVSYDGWTFGGSAPGPALRATVGDTVDFTLVNRAPIPHSMDFHAAEIAPNKYYTNILPGDSIHYRFVPRVPGVFMYHCGTAPVAAHIANGMFGALIVDPRAARPPADELVLVQSELYTASAPPPAALSLDWDKLLGQAPDYVVFNGRSAQYAKHPIPVGVGDLLRIYMVNAGPNRTSSFHVVGGIFDRVFLDGTLVHPLEGVQTVSVPVGGSAIFELRLKEAGTYPFVTHAFADATKGAVGMFQAGTGTAR